MDNSGDLRLLLDSRYPLIMAEERDEQRFLSLVREAAARLGLPVWTWSLTRGLARDGGSPQYRTREPLKALAFVALLDAPGVFVFLDAGPVLSDPAVIRQVKEIAGAAKPGQTLVLASSTTDLPAELSGLALPWRLQPPSPEEAEELVRRTIDHLGARNLAVRLDAAARRALVEAVRGLSASHAERLIQQAALKDGTLDGSDVVFIRAAKADLLDSNRVLELVHTAGTLDSVGGMDRLKEWLRLRGKALEPEAASFGLEPPRGILLTGVPGCGKSLLAKTVAGTWGLPLVLLDPEFLRKGRFDEIFFVDLPGPEERREIFRLHLARRSRNPDAYDLEAVARASDGFSGAEIEAAVVGALYRAYAAGSELTLEEILAEMRSTVPLSKTRAEEISRLRAWAEQRCVPV